MSSAVSDKGFYLRYIDGGLAGDIFAQDSSDVGSNPTGRKTVLGWVGGWVVGRGEEGGDGGSGETNDCLINAIIFFNQSSFEALELFLILWSALRIWIRDYASRNPNPVP